MMKYIYTPLFLAAAFAVATPASANCTHSNSQSSTVESCERGVAVFRGQQNGPDFRFAKLKSDERIAQSRAREAEARAQALQRQQSLTVNQNNLAGGGVTGGFGFGSLGLTRNRSRRLNGRRGFIGTPRAGLRNFGNVSSPLASSSIGRVSDFGFGTGAAVGTSVGIGTRFSGAAILSPRRTSRGVSAIAGVNARPPLGGVRGARAPLLGGRGLSRASVSSGR